MKKLFAAVAMALVSIQAWAIDLGAAKQQGLVGERSDGYVGYVVQPASAEVKTLVKSVNTKRKANYQKIAAKNGITLEQVMALAAKKAVAKTKAGNYYQNASGAWVKK